MKNKYYVPAIEDVFVGYECELYLSIYEDDKWTEKNWVVGKVSQIFPHFEWVDYRDVSHTFPVHGGEYFELRIRTPYLTKEQIEKEGWTTDPKGKFDKGKNSLAVITIESTIFIRIINKYLTLYFGKCPSINEFRKICNLLDI